MTPLFVHLEKIPSVFQYAIGALGAGVVGGFGWTVKWFTTHEQVAQRNDAETDEHKANAERATAEAEVAKEQKRELEINGLRSIIEELRISRDEALKAQKLLTVAIETLRTEVEQQKENLRRSEEHCSEQVLLVEANSEKRIELLKRQHTEEIAQLARQLTVSITGSNPPKVSTPIPAPPRRSGEEPTIDSAVESVVSKMRDEGTLS